MKRSAASQRRLLGEARRESAKAAHIAAIKRRRLATPNASAPTSANASNATNKPTENSTQQNQTAQRSDSQNVRKRRKFLKDTNDDDDNDDDDEHNGPISSGALGDDDAAVFADAVYEDDDREADLIYAQVEQRMQSRRQKQRDQILQQQLNQYRQQNPSIRQQFADLKTDLSQVSQNQWAEIPDIGDFSIKKQKFQRFTPLPDTLLERARQEHALSHDVNIELANSNKNESSFPSSSLPSTANPNSNSGVRTDLAAIGAGRTSVLELNLDAIGQQQPSAQNIDQDGYLSSLATQDNISAGNGNIGQAGQGVIDGMLSGSGGDIGDVKKMRSLLSVITSTNPKHAPGWMAAARLEERSGKLLDARRKIIEACRRCSRDDEVWLEAVRLHPAEAGRKLLAHAIRHVWKSEAIWLKAVELEDPKDLDKKKRILDKALEVLPQSEKLWQALIQLEPPNSARLLLRKAVQSASHASSLWLALAKLEDYEEAKSVLSKAQSTLPLQLSIHVAKAQLEETRYGQDNKSIQEVIVHAIRIINDYMKMTKPAESNNQLNKGGNEDEQRHAKKPKISTADWLQEAEIMERAGYIGTLRGIVSATALIGMPENKDGTDIKIERWKQSAKYYEEKKFIEVSRAFWIHLTNEVPSNILLWRSFAEFERRQQENQYCIVRPTEENNDNDITNMNDAVATTASQKLNRVGHVLERGVELCPTAEVLWLMLAKEVWKSIGADEARSVLQRAFAVLPKSQAIWLAAAKIESESGCYAKAREILKNARGCISSWNVFMKSALLERLVDNPSAEKELLIQGLEIFPRAEKLWLMLAQWFERNEQQPVNDIEMNGTKDNHDDGSSDASMDLSKSLVASLSNAKAVYAKAVQQCSKCAALWLGFARLEERAGMISRARAILERGRGACELKHSKSTSKVRISNDSGSTCNNDDEIWGNAYNGVDLLWRENVYIQLRLQRRQSQEQKAAGTGNPLNENEFKPEVMATNILARGLQKCPKSPWLWALSIALESRKAQKARSVEAVKVCGNNPIVITEVARYLWRSNKLEKAREWFRRAVNTHPEYADGWACLIAYERDMDSKPSSSISSGHALKKTPEELVDEACLHDLKRGERWISLRKKVGNETLTNKQVLLQVSDLVGKSLVLIETDNS